MVDDACICCNTYSSISVVNQTTAIYRLVAI